jgi:hypothetical protein
MVWILVTVSAVPNVLPQFLLPGTMCKTEVCNSFIQGPKNMFKMTHNFQIL